MNARLFFNDFPLNFETITVIKPRAYIYESFMAVYNKNIFCIYTPSCKLLKQLFYTKPVEIKETLSQIVDIICNGIIV